MSVEPPTPGVRVTVDVAALSDRGRVRERNEDAFVVCRVGRYLERVVSSIPDTQLPSRHEDSGHLMMVTDGMGGHAGGEVASRNALLSTLQFITRSTKWALKLDDPATREHEIEEMFARGRNYLKRVHEVLRQQAAADPNLVDMGTTMTGVYSLGTDLFVLHIGDSKAYLYRDGAMTRITRDHTVAQEYADMGVIRQEDVPGHRMAHVLTRAIGGPDAEINGDMRMCSTQDGDRLLLCSDGLTDMADDGEIAAVLKRHPASADACRALVDLALERGGRDNITVIVAGFAVS